MEAIIALIGDINGIVWGPAMLALLAGTFGGRLGDRGRCRLIRASSVLLAGIAVVLLVG